MTDFGYRRWLRFNLGIKRWLALMMLGMAIVALGGALGILALLDVRSLGLPELARNGFVIFAMLAGGMGLVILGTRRMLKNLLAPYRQHQRGSVFSLLAQHQKLQKGFKYVAIGGGTGLPASLRGMKAHTSNITAVVTVADDGGSSGRLRRDLGVLPPGDLRNNIAALADEDSILTRLFQFRFKEGDLEGHAFGNLFIAALANIVAEERGNGHNSLAEALTVVERVLNIQGRVLPSTLDDVSLTASVRLTNTSRVIKVRGESQIEELDGSLETIALEPANAVAYPPSVQAILDAELIVIGPGSLYTSILPNLMVKGIADALRATDAFKIYVCNVATQPVETADYSLAEHVMALEQHIGRGVFQAVIANNVYPEENAGQNTRYVQPAPEHHEILQRYDIYYTDLTDEARPWRHDTHKLAAAILHLAQKDSGLAPILKNASRELV
jgi:uncharacterized cofD-like protein